MAKSMVPHLTNEQWGEVEQGLIEMSDDALEQLLWICNLAERSGETMSKRDRAEIHRWLIGLGCKMKQRVGFTPKRFVDVLAHVDED